MEQIQDQTIYDGAIAAGILDYGGFGESGTVDETDYADAPTNSWRYRVVKRSMDVVGAIMMLLLFILPGLMIAAAIVLTSKGPVFYREIRIGRGGKPFRIWNSAPCIKTPRSAPMWPMPAMAAKCCSGA